MKILKPKIKKAPAESVIIRIRQSYAIASLQLKKLRRDLKRIEEIKREKQAKSPGSKYNELAL